MGNTRKTSERDTLQTRYLEVLSEMYPSIAAASTEIINLQAILNLPKGTEHVLSDIFTYKKRLRCGKSKD